MLAKITHYTDKIVRNAVPELKTDKKSLRYLMFKRAVESSADFIEKNMKFAEVFETREGIYEYVLKRAPEKGLLMEFGVHNGHSINAIAKLTKRTVDGFDSFEGLPDDGLIASSGEGNPKWYAGKMDNKGIMPKVRDNVVLHKGWFDQVLPKFLKENKEDVALIHIDCDIYSSTKCVFNELNGRIKKGTIILFDEYLNYEGWQKNEHRALVEFAEEFGINYDFIAYTYLGGAAIKIK